MLEFLFSRIPKETGRPGILLIDDDRDIRTVTSLVLVTHGVGTVHEAASGKEGLQMARQQRPQLILLDIGLPDIGGETVLQLLQADPWTSEIPVVLFTASSREQKRLRSLPVADIVLKPFQPEKLCEVVHRTLALNAPRSGKASGSGSLLPPRKTPRSEFAPSALPTVGLSSRAYRAASGSMADSGI